MNKLRSLKDVWNKYNFMLTRSQKRWGIVLIIMTIIGALCETLGVSIILPLVQVMIDPEQLRKNEMLLPFINGLGINSDAALIWGIGAAVAIVYVIKNLFLLLLSYVRIKYACKVQRELSCEMMESYMRRGYVFFLNTGTGELIRSMRDSIASTYDALYQTFRLLAEGLTIAFISIFIMVKDIVMAICVIALVIMCLLAVVLICQKQVKRCGEVNYKYLALINKELLQTFQGIKEVLVMQRQKYFVNAYREKYIKRQKAMIGQTVAAESPAYLIEAVCVAGMIITVCIKAIYNEDASVLVPQLASFAVAAFRILPSLGRIANNYNQFLFDIPGINDTYESFKEVRADHKSNEESRISNEATEIIKKNFKNKILIENITWKYPNANKYVLKDIFLEINKGQTIAFVGKSGAGKTTLADIILGLLQPQKGGVKIDEIDIADIPGERSKIIGFVPQNVNLLDDTVRRNIAFGIEDNEIQDELVWNALEQAQLKDVIENSEKGLDTEIGEQGIQFSGGQRQRFAIARALYCNPDILILDEATSALDTETETSVMEAIETLQGNKTLIIIAHRLTTIKNCDVIYEIIDGKAVERKYEDLL